MAFYLGMLGPLTSVSQTFLAAVVAFDLDVRKNFEPDIEGRLGTPIVDVPDLHPQLRVQPIIGTSDSNSKVAALTALNWAAGLAPFPQVVGVVGGMTSAIAMHVATVTSAFDIPQVAGRAASPELSDKTRYPFFSRTALPVHVFGAAASAWMELFRVHAASVYFSKEPYGEALFEAMLHSAGASKDGSRDSIHGVSFNSEGSPNGHDGMSAQPGLLAAKAAGTRVIILLATVADGESALEAMEQDGMLFSGRYQILACVTGSGKLAPSRDLPVGFQKFVSVTNKGPLFPRFSELWMRMSPHDLYSDDARKAYMVNDMLVALEEAESPRLTADDFTDTSTLDPEVPFIFDAAYAFVFAINDLLNQGVAREHIAGARLLNQLRQVSFEGVTGHVSFNADGDRLASLDLLNVKEEEADDRRDAKRRSLVVGSYSSSSGNINVSSALTWANGEVSWSLPDFLRSCADGFEDIAGSCRACSPGVGCGYQADEGFPIGILGPFTSVSPDFLAVAALFDLDFRKHSDPALRARFGDPIIDIPNMHPDLKIKTQMGTSDSQVGIGVQTTMDWLLGLNGTRKVAGIVGGYHSAVSESIAANTEVFQVPQVSWASTSPALSDKSVYPYFSRVVPSDSLQSAAVWAWMIHFEVPSIAFIYTREPYGEGLFQSLSDIVVSAEQAARVAGVGVAASANSDLDPSAASEAAAAAKSTGAKFLLTAFARPGQSGIFLYAMEELGMLYSSHQTLMINGVSFVHREYVPSQGVPHGLMTFTLACRGSRFPQLLHMWQRMTPEDIYGPEATERYMLNNFKVQLAEAGQHALTNESFASEPFHFSPFIVDAAYTLVLAINDLLNEGVAPQEIQGQRLLQAVRAVRFEGVTGMLAYDRQGDRPGNYELYNVQEGNDGDIRHVATWRAGENKFEFTDNDTLTWAGGVISSAAPASLTSCSPGYAWDATTALCVPCALNFFSKGGDRATAKCKPCDGGTVGILPLGSEGCIPCPSGTYRSWSEDRCTPCDVGTFAASAGMSACVQCEVGSYAPEPGMVACNVCGANHSSQELFTTMRKLIVNGITEYSYLQGAKAASDCGCNKGARQDGHGECIPCKTGMICSGMDDVKISQGFYAKSAAHNGALSIFQCDGDKDRCPGGRPGSLCAAGRNEDSLTCSECLEHMTPSSDGSCQECEVRHLIPFMIAFVVCLVVLVATYHILATVKRATQSHALLLCAIAIGLLMTIMQQLGVIGMIAMNFKEPIASFMRILSVFLFDTEVLHVSCAFQMSPMQRFLLKICLIFVFLVLMCIIHCVFVICRHQWRFRQQQHALIGAIGTMFMVFYIAVASATLQPLQCQEHPNGKWTVTSNPTVICWEDEEHRLMTIVGVTVFMAVPVVYLVICACIVQQLPRRMQNGDSEFMKAFSFLFFRFRPTQHGHIIITMLRSLFLSIVLVLPDPVLQVFAIQVIFLAGFGMTLHHLPWRLLQANVLDCLCSACTLLVVCLASNFLDDNQKDMMGVVWLSLVLLVTMMTLVPCAIAWGLYRKFFRLSKPYEFFLCHHKAGAGAYTRLLKMVLLENPKVRGDVFVDSDNLDNLDRLFNYVGNDTNTLIVVCSAEIFARPWCVGEMCTARLKKVPTVVVMLPQAELPDPDFIREIESRLEGGGLEILTENGMSLAMLQETLDWIQRTPLKIEVTETISPPVLRALAARLIGRRTSSLSSLSPRGSDKGMLTTAVVIFRKACPLLYARTNMEAAATALILKKMIAPVLTHDSEKMLEPWEGGSPHDVLHDRTSVVTILCTNGIFEQEEILEVLLLLPFVSAPFLPVIGEAGFRFPQKDLALLQKAPPAGMTPEAIKSVAQCLQILFKEIAITFDAQHMGDGALKLAAAEVAKRLLNPSKRTRRGGAGGGAAEGGETDYPVTSSRMDPGPTRSPSVPSAAGSDSFSIISAETETRVLPLPLAAETPSGWTFSQIDL